MIDAKLVRTPQAREELTVKDGRFEDDQPAVQCCRRRLRRCAVRSDSDLGDQVLASFARRELRSSSLLQAIEITYGKGRSHA